MSRSQSKHRSVKYRRRQQDKLTAYPDGYLEDFFTPEESIIAPCKSPRETLAKSNLSNVSSIPFEENILTTFQPVSVILSTDHNALLNKTNDYKICFNTGMLEGVGVCINDDGASITFENAGSYRFEINGEATPFSTVEAKLVFFSDMFAEDVTPFSETLLQTDNGKLDIRGIATILPIKSLQTITTRLIPTPDESIVILSGTRLLIHRVA